MSRHPLWSRRQLDVFEAMNDPEAGVLVVPGPVQSGKSHSTMWAFLLWATLHHSGRDFVLASKSARQLHAAVVKYAKGFGEVVGAAWTRREEPWELPSAAGPPNRFYPLLGSDAGSADRARSFSAAGAYIDEATLVPADFLNSVLDRCSAPGAKAVLVMNPAGPHHPIKREMIDREPDGLRHIAFSMADNPSLTDP